MEVGKGSRTKARVVQELKGISLRSFRLTDTLRKANRYAVFSDKKMNEVGFPNDLNELRSYIYTFSVINNDLRAFVPSSFVNDLNRRSLRLGKALGDYNAIKNTLTREARKGGLAGIGERAVRRVGGKLSGKLLNNVIPAGTDVFSRAAFRGVRSAAGANLTIEMDRLLKGSKPGTVSTAMAADFSRLAKKGELNAEVVAEYVRQKVAENTPVESGALFNTLRVRKGRKGTSVKKTTPDYHVKIGNVQPMPDPRVPYPWVVEFGINKGFNKGTMDLDANFPIPNRFRFLERVTGPRPKGDTFYGGFYNQDNRGPFERAPKNYGKGAMVRRALQWIVEDSGRVKTFTVGLPKYRTNPFKELVWNQAQTGILGRKGYFKR